MSTRLIPIVVPSSGVEAASLQTTNVGAYICNCMLVTGFFGVPILRESVNTDNPNIRVRSLLDANLPGTETVTYYYGNTFFTPEPTSLAMLSLGLATVAGLAWRQQRQLG
jgi:hypothetical protein